MKPFSTDRDQRIEQRLTEYISANLSGQPLTADVFATRYPELMPELAERLRTAQAVLAARANAHDEAHITNESAATVDPLPTRSFSSKGTQAMCPHCHNSVAIDSIADWRSVQCVACQSVFEIVASDEHLSGLSVGDTVGRFELVSVVGQGGFGTVWRAHDPQLDRTVALKIPRRGDLSAEEAEWFLREARNAAQIHHPNIVGIHEVGRDGDRIYLVSDLIDGLSLAQRIRQRPPTINEAAELTRTIALALDHIHQAEIVHRDLKSSNILIDQNGVPFVVDFGLARRHQNDITLTMDGHVVGTPSYMSPEQARGDSHTADARSDIYSLGVILFEMLTGELPFRGLPHAVFQQIVEDEPPNPRRLNPLVPRDLATLCLKCLEKNPENRFASASELGHEIGRFQRNEPIRSRATGPMERSWRWSRRRPYAAMLIGLLGTVSIVAPMLAIRFFAMAQAAKQSEAATAQSELEKGEMLYSFQMRAVQSAMEEPNIPDIRSAGRLLDQQIPTLGATDLRDFEWFYWQKKRNQGLLWQREVPRPDSVVVSCDGRWLAVGSVTGFVRIEHLPSGETFDLTPSVQRDEQATSVYCVAFSPDSRWVALGTGTQVSLVEVFELESQKRIATLSPESDWVQAMQFSPDGHQLAIATFGGTVEFWQDLKPDSHVAVRVSEETARSLAYSPDGALIAVQGGKYHGLQGEIRVLDATTHKVIAARNFEGHKLAWGVVWNADGSQVFTARDHAFVVQRFAAEDLQDAPIEYAFSSQSRIGPIAISPDKSRLVAGGTDGVLVAWSVDSGKVFRTWPGHLAEVMEISVFPDGNQIVTCSRDGFVRCWSLDEEVDVRLPAGLDMPIYDIQFSPDGSDLFLCGYDNGTERSDSSAVCAWSISKNERRWLRRFSEVSTHSLVATPTSDQLITGHSDGHLRRWDATSGDIVQKTQLTDHALASWIKVTAVSRDGTRLVAGVTHRQPQAPSGTLRQEIIVLDQPSNRVLARWKAHDRVVQQVVFHPNADEVFSVGYDKVVRRWTTKGELISELPLGRRVAHSIHFVDQDRILAVIDADGTIWRWSLDDNQSLAPITQRAGNAGRSAISPNGYTLAIPFHTKGRDALGEVKLFDTRTWETKMTLSTQTSPTCCRFSPDGRSFAAGTTTGDVYLWHTD